MSTAPTDAPASIPPAASVPPAAPETSPAPTPPAQAETDWKAEARKWESRAKENSDAAARLKEIEDAQKTEAQKAADAQAAAEKRAADAEARLLRYEAAQSKNVPAHLIPYLTGNTREEFEASADKVLADFAASAAPPPPTGVVVPGEGTTATGPSQLTRQQVEQMAREGKSEEIEKARVEGRLNDLLGIKPT